MKSACEADCYAHQKNLQKTENLCKPLLAGVAMIFHTADKIPRTLLPFYQLALSTWQAPENKERRFHDSHRYILVAPEASLGNLCRPQFWAVSATKISEICAALLARSYDPSFTRSRGLSHTPEDTVRASHQRYHVELVTKWILK